MIVGVQKGQRMFSPYFPCADVCGTWSSLMDPTFVSEAKQFQKKDQEVFIIPSNQLKEDIWIVRCQVLLDLCDTDSKLRVSL